MEWFQSLDAVYQALIATLFTWFVTALGASVVFLFKTIHKTILNGMMGFAAGVMIAASVWSLLIPSIEMSQSLNVKEYVPALIGFLLGGAFLWLFDQIIPHLHIGEDRSDAEGVPTSLHRSILLVFAITLHNIPEGLAVGIAFGAVAGGAEGATLAGAIALAIGMAIQNFPEGASVSLPLRRDGFSRMKSFMYGQASAIVEPIAGVIGALLVVTITPIQPYALAFAAGAMIYVVVEELIPEAQRNSNTDIATIGCMLGFAVMMTLDVALG
ncbi:ZIP family metal transporter [Abyssicoccus albus]|uniref:ZIP family metal transporter n=1 Tax=Abyssicoccus albus TaxID=1817405 RepID=UPI00097E3A0B|nr:ZIP family metal transporter [Abyssicoccus albus]AQL55674.1 ZIP family metal transporter [Abyssicoccus albus]